MGDDLQAPVEDLQAVWQVRITDAVKRLESKLRTVDEAICGKGDDYKTGMQFKVDNMPRAVAEELLPMVDERIRVCKGEIQEWAIARYNGSGHLRIPLKDVLKTKSWGAFGKIFLMRYGQTVLLYGLTTFVVLMLTVPPFRDAVVARLAPKPAATTTVP